MKNRNSPKGFLISLAIVIAACLADGLYLSFANGGGPDTGAESAPYVSAPSQPDLEAASDIPDGDRLAAHRADLESRLDLDMLFLYQEDAAGMPDTADLDAVSYRILNGNTPFFDPDLITDGEFELYSEFDSLGRCGMAFANISEHTMPKDGEERGSISSVKPSGWHSVRLDGVDGGYLYNRCHLIGYQLGAENANELNLITGTRHLNIQGMLGFENAVARHVKETGCHVLYAVTPIYKDDELVARGVLMEAYSVEDGGALSFCAFCYNNQPGFAIDYSTGELAGSS